jgi:GNAT superfamily N-acetyltransferase
MSDPGSSPGEHLPPGPDGGGGSDGHAAPAGVYALLADGRTVEIRPAAAADFEAVKAMHEAMSPDNVYLRFFSISRVAAELEARRVTREPGPRHAALLALYGGQVVGVASYEADRGDGKTAEVAFAVSDTMHHRGIATLLLEHLVSLARARQLEALTAETLQENTGMLRVFSEAGLPVVSKREEGVVSITIPLPPDDTSRQLDDYLDTVAGRERSANVASLRPVFAPSSVAVIGASRRTGTVGRSVLDNIRAGGFAGKLYAVNPGAREIGGVPCFPDVASLPETPDLAVLAVPPLAVVGTAQECGQRGVRGPTASASRSRRPALTRRSRRLIRHRGASASSCNPAASASRWWTTSPGWGSASPRSPPSATSSTSRATTCSCGGSRTGRPRSPCSTSSPSATRASSGGPPGGSA